MGCPDCNGRGQVLVDDDYVNDHIVAQGQLGTDTDTAEALRESLRNTVRPCHVCAPDQYRAWLAGQYQPRKTTGRPGRRPHKRST